MAQWLVEIFGEEQDLRDFKDQVIISGFSVLTENGRYFMQSHTFDTLREPGVVREQAKELLPRLNGLGLLRLPGFRSFRIGNIIELTPDGERKEHAWGEVNTTMLRLRMHATGTVTNPDGTPSPPASSNPYREVADLAVSSSDPRTQDAIRFWGYIAAVHPSDHDRTQIWLNLRKVYEVIRDDLGGHKNLVNYALADDNDLTRFVQTVNGRAVLGDNAVHAVQDPTKMPANPMSEHEARGFIGTMLQRWLDSKR